MPAEPVSETAPPAVVLRDEEYLSTLLGRSQDWIKRQCRSGRMPHRRVGSAYRFTDEDIASYIASTARTSRPSPAPTGVSPRSRRLRKSA